MHMRRVYRGYLLCQEKEYDPVNIITEGDWISDADNLDAAIRTVDAWLDAK